MIPALEAGDRLNRLEFERRYAAMPRLKKAELIEGTVYMAAAVRFRHHAHPHALLLTWLSVYAATRSQLEVADNATVRLDLDNEPQPDIILRVKEEAGGQSQISEDDYIEGAPELIVEIAASTASDDLHQKFNLYRRHGVQEYLVWRVLDGEIDWFCLREGEYQRQIPDDRGRLSSDRFPGLVLDVPALLAGNLADVLASLSYPSPTPNHGLQ
ncbi:Uma2 family endonuclease [Prochlorothrix hollandica]|uniref:Uma2 family endonuclease n=1 Tax=Prochlorothrix hollandica TaxID=1223 RepID=UPI00333EE5F7